MAKAAKGFSGLRIFKVEQNDSAGYRVDQKITITGAQSFTRSPETSEWKIMADDGVYDSGSDWQGEKFTLNLAECPLELKKYFEGGEYDDETQTYKYYSHSQAPELAFAFKVLQSDKTWLMVKLFSVKCYSLRTDYQTKGESSDISPAIIEGIIKNRVIDNQVREEKEAPNEGALIWLDSINPVPT